MTTDQITDTETWQLLGVRWNRDGSCLAHVEYDSRGNAFTTHFNIQQPLRPYTDNRGRTRTPERPRDHFACRNCGAVVEWRKNKSGKPYLAEPARTRGYHFCSPEGSAWYELQKQALAYATAWCVERGLEVNGVNLAQAVNPEAITNQPKEKQ
jgi:hypothetical protein